MVEREPRPTPSLLELIEQLLQGTATEAQLEQLRGSLRTSSEARRFYLHYMSLHSALRCRFAFEQGEEPPAGTTSETTQPATGYQEASRARDEGGLLRLVGWWSIITAAVIAVLAALYSQQPRAERTIAKVTGLSGSFQWTGSGGRVVSDLKVGDQLPGGTIEAMTPDSWFELQLRDGSTVTISGNSVLTFSDEGQKKLYLKEGNVSGNIRPQPPGKPMLIFTRSAALEVLGTQFEVEAQLAATMVNVNRGRVRVRRLSDGSTVDVPAKHRVVAAADRQMELVPVPESVNRWKSHLHLGPAGTLGRWLPPGQGKDATLKATPYTLPSGKTIFVASFGVSRGDKPPVVVQPGSRLRVRGRIASSHHVYFGVTLRTASGEFAGKFQTIRPASAFPAGKDFQVILPLGDFQLDPSLSVLREQLPKSPFHLVVESMWCHTLYAPAGLEIAEVELLPPEASDPAELSAAEPARKPSIDIWTAAARGNVQVVKQHLDAGMSIDATFLAPGTPGSGATPLHLAVLCDQHEVARLLIDRGANLNVRAEDQHGGTPLHWAAALGRVEMARLLIDAGADVNAADNHGFTPLDATAYNPEAEKEAKSQIAELLRSHGGKSRSQDTEKPAPR